MGAGIALLGYGLMTITMTPAQLATFLTSHSASRGAAIRGAVQSYAHKLEALDRMYLDTDLVPPVWIGANLQRDVPRRDGRLRMVGSIAMLRETVQDARRRTSSSCFPAITCSTA